MGRVDVLVITALPEELDAAKAAGLASTPAGTGVPRWEERDLNGAPPFSVGKYRVNGRTQFTVAMARPTQMGGRASGSFATFLIDRLRPASVVMCGVCAGDPAGTARGDVVIGEPVYEWDEGKQSTSGLQGDHRQFRLDPHWLHTAQDFDPSGLAAYGAASDDEALCWLLEQLDRGQQLRNHPACESYFPGDTWQRRLAQLEKRGQVRRESTGEAVLTAEGAALLKGLQGQTAGLQRLPFRVLTAPMASGSAVIADPKFWDQTKRMGMRKTIAVEMEAATIATIAHDRGLPWLVAKGVMDHADARKDDRYKGFAARASAQVLFALMEHLVTKAPRISRRMAITAAGLLAASAGGFGVARQTWTSPPEVVDPPSASPSSTPARSAAVDVRADWPRGWPTGEQENGSQAYIPGGCYQLTVNKPEALRPRAPMAPILQARHLLITATAQFPADEAGWGLWCGNASGNLLFELGVWPNGTGVIKVQPNHIADQKDPAFGEPLPLFKPGEDNELEADCTVRDTGVQMILKLNGTVAVDHLEPNYALSAITMGVYGFLSSDTSVRSTKIRFCRFELVAS
jgi:nucleoside phosphorylase